MNNFQRVAKNTVFLIISEIVIKGLSLLWVIFLAHNMSVAQYGRYNIVNSFLAIFSQLPDLGIGLIVIREIARAKIKIPTILGNALIIHSILAIATLLIVAIILPFLGYTVDTKVLIVIAGITLALSTIRSVGIFYFDGTEKMNVSAMLNSLNTVLLLFGGFLGYMALHNLVGVFGGMLIGTAISILFSWGGVLMRGVIPEVSFNPSLVKKLVFSGLPLGIASFSYLIYSRIDTLLLGQLLGEKSVGVYNASTPFVFSIIQLLNVPFVVAVFPALSRVHAEDHSRFDQAVRKSFFFVLAWSAPCAILVSYIAPLLIPVIFGQKYIEAIPVLRIAIYAVPFIALSALLYKVLIVINRQIYYLWISLLGAVVNIAANYVLIPQFGIYGAVYASLITQSLLFIIYFVVVTYFLRKRIYEA